MNTAGPQLSSSTFSSFLNIIFNLLWASELDLKKIIDDNLLDVIWNTFSIFFGMNKLWEVFKR